MACNRRQFAEQLFPPGPDEAPAHGDELSAGIANPENVNLRGGGDIVAWREIARLADQDGEAMKLGPGEMLREASAHGVNLSAGPSAD